MKAIQEDKEIEITKEDFEDYEEVRMSGITNMFDIKKVEELSNNLTREKIKAIRSNYEKLMKEYPNVRK